MAYRWHPKHAEVDPSNPQAWGACDRCSRIWNLHNLRWQYDYNGSSTLQNLRILVCETCYDVPQPQLKPYVLSPDPVPVFNARPGASDSVGEASYLITEDGEVIETEDDLYITTYDSQTDPSTSMIRSTIAAPSATVTSAYLDLFDGDPVNGGRSVLLTITGSSTRTDIASDLSLVDGNTRYVNPDFISITSSAGQSNVSYVALYSASISGSLLWSGSCSASPIIADGVAVKIPPIGLILTR